MIIASLNRHLYVCGRKEVQPILNRDKKFWNIISIREPTSPSPTFIGARKILKLAYYDIENPDAPGIDDLRLPMREDMEQVLSFVDAIPGEPLLVHCRAGVSRSAATALVLIVRGLVEQRHEDIAKTAAEQLLALRPQAVPNVLVLRLGLKFFLEEAAADEIVVAISNHPRLMENRFVNPTRDGSD